MCQVATADLSEIVSLYKVMPYADGDVKKHAKIAYRFTIDNEEETEGTTSREVFYVGEVTLTTGTGIWMKFEDGEMKFPLHPAEYYDRWFFVDMK